MTRPGLLGFFNSIEVTQVIALQDGELINILAIAVAEPAAAPEVPVQTFLNPTPISLRGTKWKIGIARLRLSVEVFLELIMAYGQSNQWRLGEKTVQMGSLRAIAPQFIPSDSSNTHPWNGILKNNFFEGSHVLELFDTSKENFREFFKDSRRLIMLSELVNQFIPLKLNALSDRLGNVIVQIPAQALAVEMRGSADAEFSIGVEWNPAFSPRPLTITTETWSDQNLAGFDLTNVTSGVTRLRANSPRGGGQTYFWDEQNKIIIGATRETSFCTSAAISVSVEELKEPDEPRAFCLKGLNGQRERQELQLVKPHLPENFVGHNYETPQEPWVTRRLFEASVSVLKQEREFVQYGGSASRAKAFASPASALTGKAVPGQAGKRSRRLEALKDIHWLIRKHGQQGVWLWDPFLSADDVLDTLFYCPHPGVTLRALTAGKMPPEAKCKDDQPPPLTPKEQRKRERERQQAQKAAQRADLEAGKGNQLKLQLEFRIRSGKKGWAFHDRFLIFPREFGGALAWSLGTSINSFGMEHHIMQKVSHGEPIAQAFNDLWEELKEEKFLIWKCPEETVEATEAAEAETAQSPEPQQPEPDEQTEPQDSSVQSEMQELAKPPEEPEQQ